MIIGEWVHCRFLYYVASVGLPHRRYMKLCNAKLLCTKAFFNGTIIFYTNKKSVYGKRK